MALFMYYFLVCFKFSFFVVASSFPLFEPTFGGGGIDLWLRMSQSNLDTPYPRQAGLLYDLHLRMLAERRYIIMTSNSPQLISYLISVSTSISSTVWRFSPECRYRYSGELDQGHGMPQGVVTHEWGFLSGQSRGQPYLSWQGIASP